MALQAGQKLGPYEIVGALGAGGMGEVYRARDPRLGRDVAIKVLPEHLTTDSTARQRLEREARAVSALSHPNICTLYDIGHDDGIDYLVIEYLEGETLAQRLEREPLATDAVLGYAIQIADAMDKAHRQGVVHRDLKPGNIMLTAQGAKLLDFGLAKSVGGSRDNVTVAATATTPLTAQGAIVGTFQYMAPEQLEGQEADARSDIFAFGSVLFEMITGRRAFEGKTQAGLIAAIIERDPPEVSSLQPLALPGLDRLVRTCLAKDPEERRQSMHDVLLDLRWIAEAGSQAGVPAPVMRRRRHRATLAWAAAAVLALVSAALAWMLFTRPTEPPQRIVSQLLPPDGVRLGRSLALAPNGRRIVYGARDAGGALKLWVMELDSGVSRVLPGTESGRWPFWSPDSQSIAFYRGAELRRISVTGGTSIKIADAQLGYGGSWNDDGVILFAPSFSAGLYRIAASGGDAEQLTRPEDAGDIGPQFLPDGNRFLYVHFDSQDRATVRVGALDGSVDVEVGPTDNRADYSGGYLLYGSESALIAQGFDLGTLALAGEPRVLADPVGTFSANDRGMLAYIPTGLRQGSQLVGYDRAGEVELSVFSETALDDLAISPDGKRLAMRRNNSKEETDYDVWTYDLDREIFTRVTFEKHSDDPVWSADGKWIVYSTNPKLYRVRSNGAGEPELLLDSSIDDVCHDWSHLGNQVLISRYGENDQLDLWSLEVGAGAEPQPVLTSGFSEWQGEFSPDGKWLAYTSNESGKLQVYVRSWPDLTEKLQVSTEGGGMPRWRADGRELFYVSPERELSAVAISPSGSGLAIGEPATLFKTRTDPDSRSTDYVVTPDGDRFLFIEEPEGENEGPTPITLVQEFLATPGS